MQVGLNNCMENFGERVKFRRSALGLSQVAVAKTAGLKQSDISKIEHGTIMETKKLLGLAKALQCRPEWLVSGRGEQLLTYQDIAHRVSENVVDLYRSPMYDDWTLAAIGIMMGLKEYQREGALAALKTYVSHLGPPRDGQALSVAGKKEGAA